MARRSADDESIEYRMQAAQGSSYPDVRSRKMSPEEMAIHFPNRPSAVKGRKKCTTCGKLPQDMVKHWGESADTHGPISTANPEAVRNLPGLKKVSEDLGSIFNNRRRW